MQTDQAKVGSPPAESEGTVHVLTPKVTSVSSMMQKKYSESISLSRVGMSRSYRSECCRPSARSYSTGVEMVPRMKPRYHTSAVRVDGGLEDTVVYHERVQLAYCMLMSEFSEAVNNFPCETKNSFTSTLTYDPDYVHRRYITSVEMAPSVTLTIQASESGEEMRTRGEDGLLQTAVFFNGTVA